MLSIKLYAFFTVRLTGREPLVFLPGPFSNEPPNGKSHLKQCEQMTLTRRQKRMCRREPGLAETLRESVRLSLLECRYQFRNERWNCSMDGRASLLKRGNALRELQHPPNWRLQVSKITFRCLYCEYCELLQQNIILLKMFGSFMYNLFTVMPQSA